MSYTSKKPCTISASDEFDCIEICGKFALFTDERLGKINADEHYHG